MSMVPTGYPNTNALPNEVHVASQPNSDVSVSLPAAVSMSSAPNGISGFSGNLQSSIALHNLAVPSSPGYLNGAACKIKCFVCLQTHMTLKRVTCNFSLEQSWGHQFDAQIWTKIRSKLHA